VAAAELAVNLEAATQEFVAAGDQNPDHWEAEVLRQTQELQRRAVEAGAQAKADATPPCCPVCRQQLTRLTHGHERTFRTCFEPGTYGARAAGVVAIRSGVSRPTLRGGLQRLSEKSFVALIVLSE